ncbi:MAG: HPF/RaiA family ribosome-associated protein [Lacunisphaera sp.]
MTTLDTASHRELLLLSGIHLELSDAMKLALESKAARLFRRERRIVRVRVEVIPEHRGGLRVFTAKGKIEIAGPDLCAAVTNVDAYAAINLLIGKLDRMLRKRATAGLRNRGADDIRNHLTPVAIS